MTSGQTTTVQLSGTVGKTVIIQGSGTAHVQGGQGSDSVLGGDGGDSLTGGLGDDIISGGSGNDDVYGLLALKDDYGSIDTKVSRASGVLLQCWNTFHLYESGAPTNDHAKYLLDKARQVSVPPARVIKGGAESGPAKATDDSTAGKKATCNQARKPKLKSGKTVPSEEKVSASKPAGNSSVPEAGEVKSAMLFFEVVKLAISC